MMNAVSYVINVSQHGRHVFRTDPDSLRDEDTAKVVYVILCKKFTAKQGFDVDLSVWRCGGTRIAERARDK